MKPYRKDIMRYDDWAKEFHDRQNQRELNEKRHEVVIHTLDLVADGMTTLANSLTKKLYCKKKR